LIITIISILIKEVLFHYKYHLGKKYNSSALISEAWHHRSDSMSSFAALLGIGSAIIGEHFNISLLLYGDAIAGIIVSVIVIKVGYDLAKESSIVIMEKVLDKESSKIYKQTVKTVDGVMRIDQMYARTHGSYVVIDIKISVDPDITVKEGHDIAKEVKQTLLKKQKNMTKGENAMHDFFRKEEEWFTFYDGEGKKIDRKTEIRYDPLTGESSRLVFDPGMDLTPPDYTEAAAQTEGKNCPFCPENVHKMTPV